MCGCGKSGGGGGGGGGGGFASARIGGGTFGAAGLIGLSNARRARGGCGSGCGRAGRLRVARSGSTFGAEDFAGIVPYHLSWSRTRGSIGTPRRSFGIGGGSPFAPGASPFGGRNGGCASCR